ncbi:MAG: hypothetical protein DI582_09425 [Azospirillum brasilense]|nr:MAG: hypothetical protein DI582_09425 [Azospirillum brasilense]
MVKTQGNKGIEAIAVKRAAIADSDKVRYRVYTSPDDYIAVIAESALMAVKVAGIAEPYRIIRDLPSEGISLKAEKLAKVADAEPVQLAITPKEKKKDEPVEVGAVQATSPDFVPMQLRDLEIRKSRTLTILSPQDLFGADFVPRPKEAAVKAPPSPPAPVPAPEPKAELQDEIDSDTLSPEDVAKLLGS